MMAALTTKAISLVWPISMPPDSAANSSSREARRRRPRRDLWNRNAISKAASSQGPTFQSEAAKGTRKTEPPLELRRTFVKKMLAIRSRASVTMDSACAFILLSGKNKIAAASRDYAANENARLRRYRGVRQEVREIWKDRGLGDGGDGEYAAGVGADFDKRDMAKS